MVKKLVIHIIISVLGLFLAIWFVPGVKFSGSNEIVFLAGILLGLVNCFVKPLLKIISFPIRIISFGIFTLILNILLVWIVIDILSPIEIEGLFPLLATTFIIWILSVIINSLFKKEE